MDNRTPCLYTINESSCCSVGWNFFFKYVHTGITELFIFLVNTVITQQVSFRWHVKVRCSNQCVHIRLHRYLLINIFRFGKFFYASCNTIEIKYKLCRHVGRKFSNRASLLCCGFKLCSHGYNNNSCETCHNFGSSSRGFTTLSVFIFV